MKWIKASKRLPVWKEKILNHLEEKVTYNIFIKAQGLGFCVSFNHYKEEFVLLRSGNKTIWGKDCFEKYNIEWLDEFNLPIEDDVIRLKLSYQGEKTEEQVVLKVFNALQDGNSII